MKLLKVLLSLTAFAAVSCGPSRHAVQVEMRYPSKAGIELSGKTISVVYLENQDKTAADFNSHMADGFAYALEEEYGTGEGSVPVFSMHRSKNGNYADKDTLFSLLMDTGSDVVFLIDTVTLGSIIVDGAARIATPVSPDSSYLSVAHMPFTLKMYSFDAMDKSGSVKKYGGTSEAQPMVYSDGKDSSVRQYEKAMKSLPAAAWEVGNEMADSFRSQWKHEQYSLTFFDSEKWYRALDRAESYDWKGAMDIWMDLLKTNDLMKRSCAEYNIAVACYMLGDYSLAAEWLDLSDADTPIPYSDALRKRITARQ